MFLCTNSKQFTQGNIFDCEIKIIYHNNKMICPFVTYDGKTKKIIEQHKNED